MQNKRSKFGYTLVELLVVMGVMVVLMSLTFPVIKMYGKRHSLKQGAEMVKQLTDQARINTRALPQDLDISSYNSYRVLFDVNTDAHGNIAICPSGDSYDSNSFATCSEKRTVLPSKINVKEVKWWDGDNTENYLDDDVNTSEAGIQFNIDTGEVFILKYAASGAKSGSYTKISSPFPSSNLIIRFQNLDDARTNDLVINVLTGFMYIK